MIATGLYASTDWKAGRDAQSIAFFKHAGDAVVELRRAEHEPVGRVDVGQQFLDRRRPLVALEILIVQRDRREIVELQIGAAGEFLPQGLEDRVRIGTGAQAAGHSDEDRGGLLT